MFWIKRLTWLLLWLGAAAGMNAMAGVSGHRQGGSHAGDHLKGDAVLGQRQSLFPSPAEKERVAALEPGNEFAVLGLLDQ